VVTDQDRERVVDDPESMAEQREVVSDKRERSLGEREARLDESAPPATVAAEDRERRHQATIERARARQGTNAARIERSETPVRRVKSAVDRERADHARSTTALKRTGILPPQQPGAGHSPRCLRCCRKRVEPTQRPDGRQSIDVPPTMRGQGRAGPRDSTQVPKLIPRACSSLPSPRTAVLPLMPRRGASFGRQVLG